MMLPAPDLGEQQINRLLAAEKRQDDICHREQVTNSTSRNGSIGISSMAENLGELISRVLRNVLWGSGVVFVGVIFLGARLPGMPSSVMLDAHSRFACGNPSEF
jgi:hypothetical protein